MHRCQVSPLSVERNIPPAEFPARGRAWRAGVEDRFLLVRPGRKARQPAWRQARVLLRKRGPAVIRAEHAVGRADEVDPLVLRARAVGRDLEDPPRDRLDLLPPLAAVFRHVQPRIAAHQQPPGEVGVEVDPPHAVVLIPRLRLGRRPPTSRRGRASLSRSGRRSSR